MRFSYEELLKMKRELSLYKDKHCRPFGSGFCITLIDDLEELGYTFSKRERSEWLFHFKMSVQTVTKWVDFLITARNIENGIQVQQHEIRGIEKTSTTSRERHQEVSNG